MRNDDNTIVDIFSEEDRQSLLKKPIDIDVDSDLSLDELINNTVYEIRDIMNYTDEEKDIINYMMGLVFSLEEMIDYGKIFYHTREYITFMNFCSKDNEKINKHFKKIYKSLIVSTGIAKINRVIFNPMASGNLDMQGIWAEILNIMSVDENFDFKIFKNDKVLELAYSIKNTKLNK